MASTAAIQIHGVSATYLHAFSDTALMEWKWRVPFSRDFRRVNRPRLPAAPTAALGVFAADLFDEARHIFFPNALVRFDYRGKPQLRGIPDLVNSRGRCWSGSRII